MKHANAPRTFKMTPPLIWIVIVLLIIGGLLIGMAGMPDIAYA